MITKKTSTAADISQISMVTKLLELKTPDGFEILIDVRELLTANGDDAYFRINDICKHFGMRSRNFQRLESTKRYIKALSNRPESGRLESPSKGWVYTVEGRRNSGTWLQKKLFLKFAAWVSVEFEIDMHQLVEHLITHTAKVKTDRKSTKALFHPLTDVIKSHWLPAQSENGKKFAYSNIANLINKKVIGMTAKKYKLENGIDPKATTRDTFPDDILEEIEALEKDVHGHIYYGGVTEYEVLKVKVLGK